MSVSSVRDLLDPEARLVLASAGDKTSEAELSADIGAITDWESLLGLAVRERALGPLWRTVSPFSDRLPRELRDRLEDAAAIERIRQLHLQRRLRESLAVLETERITPLLLKGAAFINTLYEDPGDRPMGDIDLLVSGTDIERARDVLLTADWTWDRERFPREIYARHYHLPPLVDAHGSGVGLELHEGLFIPGHPLEFGPDDLLRRAEKCDVGGSPALVPHPEDHLVYVCHHFAWSHALGSGGWRTFSDVGRLIDADGFAWQSFVRRAREAGRVASGYWTLRLWQDLTDCVAPDGVLDALRPPLPEFVLRGLGRHFTLELFSTGTSCPSVRLSKFLWLLGNSWSRGGSATSARTRPARPWEYSGDFGRTGPQRRGPDRGMVKMRRHLGDRGRWVEYVRRILLPAGGKA